MAKPLSFTRNRLRHRVKLTKPQNPLYTRLLQLIVRPGTLLNTDPVTEFKSMFQGTCKDTRIKVTEAVLLLFDHKLCTSFYFTSVVSQATTPLRGVLKNNSTKTVRNFQGNI